MEEFRTSIIEKNGIDYIYKEFCTPQNESLLKGYEYLLGIDTKRIILPIEIRKEGSNVLGYTYKYVSKDQRTIVDHVNSMTFRELMGEVRLLEQDCTTLSNNKILVPEELTKNLNSKDLVYSNGEIYFDNMDVFKFNEELNNPRVTLVSNLKALKTVLLSLISDSIQLPQDIMVKMEKDKNSYVVNASTMLNKFKINMDTKYGTIFDRLPQMRNRMVEVGDIKEGPQKSLK